MSLFRFHFLRKFIRRHTNPIPQDNAELWKKRLSVAYMLVCWNAVGFVCYCIYSGKADWAKFHGLKTPEEIEMTPAQQWAQTLGIKKAQVYRISGFKVTGYEINNEMKEGEKTT